MSSLLLELESVSLEVGGSSTELLLDIAFELEDFAELLLDSSFELRMTDEELLDITELDDTFVSFSSFDDEDFAELLLDTLVSLEFDCGVTLEEDDSTLGSPFAPADVDELSSHPTTINATKPIATKNFFINPPVTQHIYSKQM